MIGRGLLTEGDCRALSAALQRRQQIVLTRSGGAVRLTARTLPTGGPPWPVPMVVQVHVVGPMYSWRQNFGSILSLREAME